MADTKNSKQFSVQSFRWVDNLHILFWLIKDMSWAMKLRPLGMAMIAPTLGVAIYIMIKSRRHRAELFHNIAVCLWIAANSLWMTGEFYDMEHTLRRAAVVLFIIGLAVLATYYLFFFRKDRKQPEPDDALTIK